MDIETANRHRNSHSMNVKILGWVYVIISPAYLYISYILLSAFLHNQMYVWFTRIARLTDIAVLLIFICYPVYLITMKKRLESVSFIAIQVVVFVAFKMTLNSYDIDSERIDFILNSDRYVSLINNATPFKPGKKTYLVNIEPRYMYCERYLVYDETNEFLDPKNDYFGIGYTYAISSEGEKFRSGNLNVRVREFDNYMYIADACPNIN